MLRAVFGQPGLAGDLCGSENLASRSRATLWHPHRDGTGWD